MPPLSEKVKRFVVLMLENRSFDHLLGFLKDRDPRVRGLNGTESNPDGAGGHVFVDPSAGYGDPKVDPGHGLGDVNEQVFGTREPGPGAPITMQGFVTNYRGRRDAEQNEEAVPGDVMRCFAPERLPVLATLATEFAICDAWHSSVPGPTWPNRLYVHAATSAGAASNTRRLFGVRTLYDNLLRARRSARIYCGDIPQSLVLRRLFTQGLHRKMPAFWSDLEKHKLPHYAFIEPAYLGAGADDQHPDHDVAAGERLIADVYERIRNSPEWLHTLLVILWDEHGGLYDHVPPPEAVPPDGKISTQPPFGFERLGVRVPAVIVSAWIPRNTVDHTVYDHASVPATVKEVFGLPKFLTARDRAANRFGHLLTLDAPRTDAPLRLERPPLRLRARPAPPPRRKAPLSDLQEELVDLAIAVQKAAPGRAAAKGPHRAAAPGPGPRPADEEAAKAFVTQAVDWVFEGPARTRRPTRPVRKAKPKPVKRASRKK